MPAVHLPEPVFSARPIAYIYNDYSGKFGIPRQSGLVPSLESVIVFEEAFRQPEAFRGLENVSHLWLIWMFSENRSAEWHSTVRPPRLGGNTRVGVWATRSPFRPNPFGLSSVRLEKIEQTDRGPVLRVSGADLMNGTPILDIKPYIPYTDLHADAVAGFADQHAEDVLHVSCEPALLDGFTAVQRRSLLQTLSRDPRPAYQEDADRIYRMSFAGYTVSFTVDGDTLTVLSAEPPGALLLES